MEISFKALGGGDEIGANSYLIRCGETNIILDCGLHPRKSGAEMFPDYESVKDEVISHLIISHAHNDHIGALPYFLKMFPYAKIYSTRPTLSISEVMLSNTAFLMEREFADGWDDEYLKYYNEEMLNLIPMIIKQYGYGENVPLSEDISFEFYDAGHILGSAGVLLKAGNKSLYYTGDFNHKSQKLIPAGKHPRHKVDILITECTNGEEEENTPGYEEEEKKLAKFINAVVSEGGSVLIPSFALGKSQEMLKRIYGFMETNKIPHLPIYFSPMSRAISDIYDDHNYNVPRIEKGFKLNTLPINMLRRDDIAKGEFYKKPAVIIATSGMVIEGTVSYRLAKNFLRKKNFGIAMCGYCDPATPGYRIKNAKEYDTIFLDSFGVEMIERRCKVENFRFSSHARKEDILNTVDTLEPDTVLLVHGDEDAVGNIGHEVLTRRPDTRVIAPDRLKEYKL